MKPFLHTTVLKQEVVSLLQLTGQGIYLDGTVGGGGHSEAILHASSGAKLVAIDRDPQAIAAARDRLSSFGSRCTILHGELSRVDELLGGLEIPQVNGMVIDLGVSSHQLDSAERGFSFSHSGPLDMRMDPSQGETALEYLRRNSGEELARVIRTYGEERYSSRISQRIKDAIRAGTLSTTGDLAALVVAAIPAKEARKRKIHPATKTFQALRIAINDEIRQLETFLQIFPSLLAPRGRCVIISFHSLEDRLVKRAFRELAWSSTLPPELAKQAQERVEPICRIVTRKVVTASPAEVDVNPRARSAKLRACEKVAA